MLILRKQALLLTTMAALATIGARTASAQTADTYSITGNGTAFTATKNGSTAVGTADAPIQDVIDAIKNDASGAACTIQFGDGTDTLDIGTAGIVFDGGSGGGDWGLVTLTGTLLYNGIRLSNGASIDSRAELTASWIAIQNQSTGTVSVSGGTVSTTSTYSANVISNNDGGSISISGTAQIMSAAESPTISMSGSGADFIMTGGSVINTSASTNGNGLQFASPNGNVTVSGGSISANYGKAIYINNIASNYTVNISGTAQITSANQGTGSYDAAISIENNSIGNFTMTGGSVTGTSSGRGIFIYGASYGATVVNISGGEVSANGGPAIHNYYASINISGGAVITSANTGVASGTIFYRYAGYLTMTGGRVTNTSTTGNAIYKSSSGTPGSRIIISGGLVSANDGMAIYTGVEGDSVAVSDSAVITSANTSVASGSSTIRILSASSTSYSKLVIAGGEVRNTSSGNAVSVGATGAVTVSGGRILATDGYAVSNGSSGAAVLTGGLAFAYGASVGDVIYGNYDVSGGDAAVVAWDKAAGNTFYRARDSLDIAVSPVAAAAVWANDVGGAAGISYANGLGNAGFVEIGGVTVGKAIPVVAFPTAVGVTYDPHQTLANVSLTGGAGAGKFAWVDSAIVPTVVNGGYSVVFAPDEADVYDSLVGVVALAVGKADYDMSGVVFADGAVAYDGAAHSIYVGGVLPAGVTVSYSGNGQTAVGTYTVTAVFAVADAANYNVPASMTAVLVITAVQSYSVTVNTDGNGSASAGVVSATAGTEVVLTAAANSGFRFSAWEGGERRRGYSRR